MKRIRVTVPWEDGMHLRVAAELVQLSRRFTSEVALQVGSHIADARSVLSLMMLRASLGVSLEIKASGADEHEVIRALEEFFRGSESEAGGLNAPLGAE